MRQKGSGGPAGPEGENFAIARNISDCHKVLSPTRCGGSPLAEGAKRGSTLKRARDAMHLPAAGGGRDLHHIKADGCIPVGAALQILLGG